MPIVPVNLTNKTNPARYKQGGNAELLNCYVEQVGEEGKTNWAIYPIDGLAGWSRVAGVSGGVRALLNVDNYVYFVVNKQLYRANTSGVNTLLGSMSDFDTTGPVYIERNRRTNPDIAIVNNGVMYYYRDDATPVNGSKLFKVTETITVNGNTVATLFPPQTLTFVDGYFVISTANNVWQIGAIDDASSWVISGTRDYARADADPDSIVRVSSYQRDVVVFGENSTEFWRDTGAADFPFERVATNQYGCLSPDSVVMTMQGLTFVSSDKTVRVLNGYDAERISTHAIERDIQKISDPKTISATTWTSGGHSFYVLSSNEWTWVYDSITGLWHTRKSTINGEEKNYWRVNKVVEFNNKVYAADRDLPYIYEMSSNYYDEVSDSIKMRVTLPPVTAFPKRLTFNSFYVDMEKGVGLGGDGTPENEDPEILLKWSRDGGYTFGTERRLKLGKQGSRTQRIRTYRLGQSTPDGYVFQIEAPTKTVRALYQCVADVEAE